MMRVKQKLWFWIAVFLIVGLSVATYQITAPVIVQAQADPLSSIRLTATVMATEDPLVSPTTEATATMTPSPAVENPPPSEQVAGSTSAQTIPLVIHSFEATVTDYLETSKNITFTWQVSGATQLRIYGGTHQYSSKWWNPAVDGSLYIVALGSTVFRDPTMTLVAANGRGDVASKTIVIPWQCEFQYYFTPAPIQCPWHEPSSSIAIEQQFENGRMIWIEQIRSGEQTRTDRVYVFEERNNGYGVWRRFDSVAPTSSIAEAPPEGLLAPQNRFGRVWQDNEVVQRDLGWALAGEASFETTWQWQLRENDPPVAYVRTIDGRIIELYGRTSGGWHYLETEN